MLAPAPDRLAASIVSFCRFARLKGIPAGTQQSLAALQAAKTIGLVDWQLFYFALRTVLCSSPEQWEEFERIFNAFWNSERARPGSNSASRQTLASQRLPEEFGLALELAGESSVLEDQGRAVSGASARERFKKVDFSEVSHNDLSVLEKLSQRLLREMSARLSRRLKAQDRGERVDLRRSIRRSIAHGGDVIYLAHKGRKPEKRRLVIFLDVSGSMNLYSLFLVRFAYALQKYFQRVKTFLFSTCVVEVSDVLRARRLPEAMAGVSRKATGWSGGTKIGSSLREFNRQHGRSVLSRGTVFMILSDGWDTGAPEMLAAELRSTRRKVEKVVWLNPLLGMKEYRPVTRGMSAALPYVDVFAPAHNLESLLALEKYL